MPNVIATEESAASINTASMIRSLTRETAGAL